MGVFTRYADDQGLLDYGDFMEAIEHIRKGPAIRYIFPRMLQAPTGSRRSGSRHLLKAMEVVLLLDADSTFPTPPNSYSFTNAHSNMDSEHYHSRRLP